MEKAISKLALRLVVRTGKGAVQLVNINLKDHWTVPGLHQDRGTQYFFDK